MMGPMATNVATGSTVPSLMPEPKSLDSAGDPMSMIYALMSKQRNNDMASGKADVAHKGELRKANLIKQEAAFKKQEDDEQSAKAWGIFGKVASVIAIALSAVVSGVSCGAGSGLCAAACVLSTLAFAEGEAHVLTQLTGNPDVDKAFQIGCGIGAALCSGGAGIINLATATAQTAASVLGSVGQIASASCTVAQESLSAVDDKSCRDAAMALGIAGSLCAVAGAGANALGAASSGVGAAQEAVDATTTIVHGLSEGAQAGSTVAVSQFEADATDRAADAKQAQQANSHLAQLARWVIDGLKETDDSHKRALQTLQGAMQTQAQTLVIASARV
jgi:hypothetical protein